MYSKNHSEIVGTIVRDLQTGRAVQGARSWNLVCPPCFYGEVLVREIRDAIDGELEKTRVSVVAADGVHTFRDLVQHVAVEWGVGTGVVMRGPKQPGLMLTRLLDAAGAGTNVLIIREFRKLLAVMDERILSAMREAEQGGRLHTLAVCNYGHQWLREAWRREGKIMNVSNYGDQHIAIEVLAAELGDVADELSRRGISGDLAEHVYVRSGGVPEVVDAVIAEIATPDGVSGPDLLRRMSVAARVAIRPLARAVDGGRGGRFSDAILRVHEGRERPEDRMLIERAHAWPRIILVDGQVRSLALVEALIADKVQAAFASGNAGSDVRSAFAMIEDHYVRGYYSEAAELAARTMEFAPSGELGVARANAEIMACLASGMADGGGLVVDTEWARVLGYVRDARCQLARCTHAGCCAQLELRYAAFERLAEVFRRLGKDPGARLLDTLGGMRSAPEDRWAAFVVLALQLESARGFRGDAVACKLAMELPEQMIRLWGWWKHGANFYQAPAADPDVVRLLDEVWPSRYTRAATIVPGQKFADLNLYCYYLYCVEALRAAEPTWRSITDFHEEMGQLQPRLDMAHAVIVGNKKMRAKFFSICDLWLARLDDDCVEDRDVARERVLELVSPLSLPRLAAV